MRLTLILLGCFIGVTTASAQLVQYRLTVKNITPIATKTFTFTVGADPQGTDGLDTVLDEIEIPDIPLPGDIFYVWTVAPTSDAIWLSPRDFRTFTPGSPSYADHDLRVNWTGGRLEISWSGALPPQIDSMYITDGYSDFPNNIVKTKVEPGAKFETSNPALDRFRVLVWYNGTTSAVVEDVPALSALHFYPNPVGETLHLAGLERVNEIQILDITGRVVKTWAGSEGSVSLPTIDISPGTYVLSVVGTNGSVRTAPFIHY
ncbi:MAG: T9SS C-terminal target domain-containing protein [Ignavibacteriae bacterium]|nr:MAG: T9SS C-terminal target domain-containing protein [Ignavibacteriota bacterium]